MHFEIPFYGHKNIRSLHQKTIEITTEQDLTLNGDCIIGVGASCGCNDIPEKMKKLLQSSKTKQHGEYRGFPSRRTSFFGMSDTNRYNPAAFRR